MTGKCIAIMTVALLALAESGDHSIAEVKPTVFKRYAVNPFIGVADAIDKKLPEHLWWKRPIAFGITAACAVIAAALVASAVVAGGAFVVVGSPIWFFPASFVLFGAVIAGVTVAVTTAFMMKNGPGGGDDTKVVLDKGNTDGQASDKEKDIKKNARIVKISFDLEKNNYDNGMAASNFVFNAQIDNGDLQKYKSDNLNDYHNKSTADLIKALPIQNQVITIQLPKKQGKYETVQPMDLGILKIAIEKQAKSQNKSVDVIIVEHHDSTIK